MMVDDSFSDLSGLNGEVLTIYEEIKEEISLDPSVGGLKSSELSQFQTVVRSVNRNTWMSVTYWQVFELNTIYIVFGRLHRDVIQPIDFACNSILAQIRKIEQRVGLVLAAEAVNEFMEGASAS